MSRGLRIDAPGMLQHVTFRGVNGCSIFEDDLDRVALRGRLNRLVVWFGFACFAWVFMSNHIHLVLQTGDVELWRLMHRLGTGYALYFNHRHGRSGHLWQDRYWSRPVEKDADTVVEYVHENPLRAGLTTRERHAQYEWCGHGGIVGAREKFEFERVAARIRTGHASQASSEALEALIARACVEFGVPEAHVRSGRRSRSMISARARIARVAIAEGGHRVADVARALGVHETTVSRLLARAK